MGYSDLKGLKPDIIYYAGSGWGRTGPYSERPAYSPIIDAFTGIAFANSYPGGEPTGLGVRGWNDSISAQHGVFAVLAALYHRSQTGKGQYIDLSMAEVAIVFCSGASSKLHHQRKNNRSQRKSRCFYGTSWVLPV